MNTLPERRKQTHVTDSSASAVTHPAWVVFLPRTSDCLPDPDLPFGMTTGGFPGPPARAIPLPAGVSLDTLRACGDEGAKTGELQSRWFGKQTTGCCKWIRGEGGEPAAVF